MDFQSQIIYSLPQRQMTPGVPLPFFMAYPGYLGAGTGQKEAALWKDLEYLRSLYPSHVKRYERRIRELLDRMDYDGSMIYDEYPDYLTLQRLSTAIAGQLEKEEGLAQEKKDAKVVETELPGKQEKENIQSLTQVLLFQEICRRRDSKRKNPYQRYYDGIGEGFGPGAEH